VAPKIDGKVKTRPGLRTLLCFDCTAAGVVGLTTLLAADLLAPLFGLPQVVLLVTAIANLAYGAFSYSLARSQEAPRRLVRALVAANFAWTGVCVVLAAAFAGPGRWLGVAYLIVEGVFVGVLAAAEARAVSVRGMNGS